MEAANRRTGDEQPWLRSAMRPPAHGNSVERSYFETRCYQELAVGYEFAADHHAVGGDALITVTELRHAT